MGFDDPVRAGGRVRYAQMQLLDRQVQHQGDRLVCKVDDLEYEVRESGIAYVTAILAGPLALGPRIGGPIGALMAAVARRLHPDADPQPVRLDFANVVDIGYEVLIGRLPEELNSLRLEQSMREQFISRIPGAR